MDLQSHTNPDLDSYLAKLMKEVINGEKGKSSSLIAILSSDVAACRTKLEKGVDDYWTSKEAAQEAFKKHQLINEKLQLAVEELEDYCNHVVYPTYEQLDDVRQLTEIKLTFINSYLPFSDIIDKLKDIHTYVEEASRLQTENMCHDAVLQVNYANEEHVVLMKLLSGLVCESALTEDVQKLSKVMKGNLDALRQNFIQIFSSKWNKNVQWKSSPSREEDVVTLRFSKAFRDKSDHCKDLIRALEELGVLQKLLEELWERILDRILVPLFNKKDISVIEEDGQLTISPKNESTGGTVADITILLEQVKTALKCFSDTFTDNESELIFAHFSNCSKDLMESVMEKIVLPSIPTNQSNLTDFNKILDFVGEFEMWLLEKGFITSKSFALSKLAGNLEIQFISKASQIYLLKARDLIKSGLYPLSDIDPDRFTDRSSASTKVKFPRCKVSEAIVKLSELIHEVLHECSNFSDSQLRRFSEVISDVCDLYLHTSTVIHSKTVQEIPQQTAVFYNNCMFLAQDLTLVRSTLEEDFPDSVDTAVSRVDESISEIKQLGFSYFLKQIEGQKSIVSELVQDIIPSNVHSDGISDFSMVVFEKNAKKCLHHLCQLQKVWLPVLPESVNYKSIGTLFNCLLDEIISSVLRLEDISADSALRFGYLFDYVNGQIDTALHGAPVSLEILLPKWFVFQELKLVLQGSLQEIVDRWSDGNGPLAIAFEAQEVKHLIRALFQNTERRAAALSKIR